MKCPVCDVDLAMAERQGIEIDYCPKCRGVWLDRGELDKIIERAAGEQAAPAGGGHSGEPRRDERRDDDRERYDREHKQDDYHYESKHYDGHKPHKKKKASGFLGDIFEGLGG